MSNRIPLHRSFLFRFVVVLVVAMVMVVASSGIFFLDRQTKAATERAQSSNAVHLRVVSSFVSSGLSAFGDNLTLLAATPAMGSFDPAETGRLLKTYKVSSLFIKGERVAMFDNQNILVADNSMTIGLTDSTGFPWFRQVEPLRHFAGPVRWINRSPTKTFGVTVQNLARANGVLTADFSMRRFYQFLTDYKVGEKGFVVVLDREGTVVFHPDGKNWLKEPTSISKLGLEGFDAERFDTKGRFMRLADGEEYMVNYLYDTQYHLGFLALQPRPEIERVSADVQRGMLVLLVLVFLVVGGVAVMLSMRLGRPLQSLAAVMEKVRDGDYDAESGIRRHDEVGKLAEVFDMMRISLKNYIRELASHREQLEEEVRARTEELRRANRVLELMSHTDDLTGIPNRRDIMEKIHYEMYRASRSKKPFVFVLGDIDKFKLFNDTYGHDCGDLVLKTVAQAMRSTLRKHDYIARWGGEEFLLVLPETDIEGSLIVAERVRMQVERSKFQHLGKPMSVTITLGIAQFDGRLGIERSISLADKALYEGKEGGRNRVIIWDPERITEQELQEAEQAKRERGEVDEFPLPESVKAIEARLAQQEAESEAESGPAAQAEPSRRRRDEDS